MAVEQGNSPKLYEIKWPTIVTLSDATRVRSYVAEGFSADESSARIVIEQADALRDFVRGNTTDRLLHSPPR